MKTAGDASITLLTGHELMAKLMLMAIIGDFRSRIVITQILVTLVRMR